MEKFEKLMYDGCNEDGVLVGDADALKQLGIILDEKTLANYDRIKNMTVEEMAIINVRLECDDDYHWYETSDKSCFSKWITVACKTDEEARGQAIQHEIEWLNSESEG